MYLLSGTELVKNCFNIARLNVVHYPNSFSLWNDFYFYVEKIGIVWESSSALNEFIFWVKTILRRNFVFCFRPFTRWGIGPTWKLESDPTEGVTSTLIEACQANIKFTFYNCILKSKKRNMLLMRGSERRKSERRRVRTSKVFFGWSERQKSKDQKVTLSKRTSKVREIRLLTFWSFLTP
jgi:hypothetical protein